MMAASGNNDGSGRCQPVFTLYAYLIGIRSVSNPSPARQLRGGSNWGVKRRWGVAGAGGEVELSAKVYKENK